MTEKQCGCITFQVGPPVFCNTHEKKNQLSDERGLRKAVREKTESLGHTLSDYSEYESTPGKWTAYCQACGWMTIVYDEVPLRGDQIAGRTLTEPCAGRSKASTSS